MECVDVAEETEQLREWLRKEYGGEKEGSFKVNQAVQLRMQGSSMATLLTHKL